jgi:hypothetical protein
MGMNRVVSQGSHDVCLGMVSQSSGDSRSQVVSGYAQSIRESGNPRF